MKMNKTSINFFYKIPANNAYELIKKLTLFSNFTSYKNQDDYGNNEQGNIVYHAETEEYNGDVWIEIDSKNKNIAFIEGNSDPFEIIEGMRKRWIVFENIYKYMKELEITGELDRLKQQYNEDFGGRMSILDEGEEEIKEKIVDIGSYSIEVPKNPLKNMQIEEEKEIKTLTVDDKKLFLNDKGEYPLIGIMGDNTRKKVGNLKYENVKDAFNKEHYVIKLCMNNNVLYDNEHISKFSKTVFDILRDNDLKAEGVLPEKKIRYDNSGMRNIVLVESNKKFICVDSKKMSMSLIKEHQDKTSMNIIPSTLEYGNHGVLDISDIQANRILVKSSRDNDFSVASVDIGGLRNRKIIIERDKETDKSVLRIYNNSPFNCEMPDVENFFRDKKETYVEFNTNLDKILLDSLKYNNINKAKVWVINIPIDTKDKKSKLFEFFIRMKEEGVNFPDKIIFNKGLLLKNSIIKGSVKNEKMNMIVDEIKNELQSEMNEMTKFPEM